MPESIRSGRLSSSTALSASSTQSVGVPSTAKRRRPTCRTRSGRCKVSEWLAPLCSCSGATTHTSRLSWRATRSSSLSPGALMPSSLQMRMRARARSMPGGLRAGSTIALQDFETAEIGPERCGKNDRAVGLLVIFEHGDERAPNSEARAVERVDEARALARLGPEARIHAPRLILAAIGAAGDLAIGVLAGQPDLDVIGLARGCAHIAGAEQHHAIRKVEPLQHLLGALRHALMLGARLVRMSDRHQLHLVELVLADHAARVLAGGARLGAEARRPGGVALRQGRLVAHQKGRRDFGVAEFARMQIEHELAERALQPREPASENDEARARQLA